MSLVYRDVYRRRNQEQYPDYEVRGKQLYKHVLHDLNFQETPTEAQWKICVPNNKRLEILQRFHDMPTVGYLEIAKTIPWIAQCYYWPRIFRDITRYVRNCGISFAHKAAQTKPAGKVYPTIVQEAWQQVAIDLVGFLPRSRNGHTWLLTMQDRFTKWLEIKPLRRVTTEVTLAVANRIIYRLGCPEQLISDNETQLKSHQMTITRGVQDQA